jgi:hypothetical protein
LVKSGLGKLGKPEPFWIENQCIRARRITATEPAEADFPSGGPIAVRRSEFMPEWMNLGDGKQVEFLQYNGLNHQFDDSTARTDLLAHIGALLDRALGH